MDAQKIVLYAQISIFERRRWGYFCFCHPGGAPILPVLCARGPRAGEALRLLAPGMRSSTSCRSARILRQYRGVATPQEFRYPNLSKQEVGSALGHELTYEVYRMRIQLSWSSNRRGERRKIKIPAWSQMKVDM